MQHRQVHERPGITYYPQDGSVQSWVKSRFQGAPDTTSNPKREK